jgi:hypothetical protein
MENPIYLGDGVYATLEYDCCNGSGATLTTGTHKQDEADNIIYLDPEVAQALVNWLGKWGVKCR